MMCVSYTVFQTCSLLMLSAVAVESHALLVALKHMLVIPPQIKRYSQGNNYLDNYFGDPTPRTLPTFYLDKMV